MITLLIILSAGIIPTWSTEIQDAAREGDIARIKYLLADKPELVEAG